MNAALTKIFYSDEFGMRSASLLYKEAKRQGLDVSHSQVKDFYDNQEVVQIFSPLKKPKPSKSPITSSYTGEKVYMDTMFFKPNKVAVINAIDLHSKYAWGKPIRLKTRADETTESVSSTKTLNFLKDVMDDIHSKGYTIDNIVTDHGVEFLSGFDAYLKENEIPHEVTEVGDHLRLAPVDAYTRGLRLTAEKWLAVNPGADLYKQIPKLIETYNNTEHATTKLTPREALTKIVMPTQPKTKTDPSSIKAGDTVRVVVRYDKNPFNKIRPNWSKELYKVTKVNEYTNRFTLNNGKVYRESDILLIPNPEKVQKHISEKKAKEVSTEEEAKTTKQKEVIQPRERSMREIKRPNYLIDFV